MIFTANSSSMENILDIKKKKLRCYIHGFSTQNPNCKALFSATLTTDNIEIEH